ncbi:hypothetical protein [Pseudomonas sp. C9]|uniref:hypothetical protein n=1 Tax=Pseudomonas sp. C9 TaxID=1311337 RepID=UPI0009861E17|nr:hypothetical protein [Pseudomonas sp. C9]OOG11867.1 hypothetical protein BMS17_07130 [Pseudomonas sp. C9]
MTLVLILPGCHSNARVSLSSPWKDGIQLHQNTVTVDAQHAKVIMKASGSTYPVEFAISRAADPDQRAEVLGTVVDSGQEKVFGWIAKLNEVANSTTLKHFPQLETQADSNEPFKVSGYASGESIGSTYRCGPLKNSFTPERSKVYLVEFQFVSGRCEQHVYDITQTQQRIPVMSLPET